MNIFMREMKKNFINFLIWLTISVFLMIYVVSMFPTFKGNTIKELINLKFPPAMQRAFGLSFMNFDSVMSLIAMMIPYIILLGGIYAGILFSGIVSKEENDGTIEFLLSKPVTRTKILLSKLFAAIFYLISFVVITFLATIISLKAFKISFDSSKLFLLTLATFMALLTFGMLCFLLSMFIFRTRTLIPLSVGIVSGTYLLKALSEISDKGKVIKYISPFEYFDAATILRDGIRPLYLSVSLIVIILCFVCSIIKYDNKDFKA